MEIDSYKATFPEWYKDWLFSSLGIKDGEETSEKLLAPLFSLNKNWLKENYEQSDYSWNEQDVARSYALYYMTINIPKLWMVLNNSNSWLGKPINEVETVTEFGCGPGTFLWSYLFYLLKNNPPALQKLRKVTAVDISPEHLATAEKLFQNLKKKKEFRHIEAEFILKDWRDCIMDSTADLAIFGNSLIESGVDSTFLKSEQFKNLLIIEPGTLEQFKRLRLLKNELETNKWSVFFPCPNNGACPMEESNWCHFSINRFILPFIQKISSAAGRKNHKHNFSAFLISKHNSDYTSDHWRVLSANRKVKRTSIRYICNGEKLVEAVLNRKERSELNRDFIKCETACCC
ncbi:MAG: small ribosomal subunit Rsm22 family protein, partial [Lentisphaeraceae bacterium]|nr:small ribosomal subunit Rsm22 family protein [Lentisphaeraceae bacterium]